MPPTLQALGIDRLSVEDRIALAQAIWDSIGADEDRMPLSESQLQDLRRRVTDDEADPDNLIPWEEVKARLRSRP
jgi:putative addiction module component (TIGR02574 family)